MFTREQTKARGSHHLETDILIVEETIHSKTLKKIVMKFKKWQNFKV